MKKSRRPDTETAQQYQSHVAVKDHWYVCQFNLMGGYDALTRSRWKWQARFWYWIINFDPVTKEFPLLLVKNYYEGRQQHASYGQSHPWRQRLAYQAMHLRRVPARKQGPGSEERPGACGTAGG